LFYKNTGLLQPILSTQSISATASRFHKVRNVTSYVMYCSPMSHMASRNKNVKSSEIALTLNLLAPTTVGARINP